MPLRDKVHLNFLSPVHSILGHLSGSTVVSEDEDTTEDEREHNDDTIVHNNSEEEEQEQEEKEYNTHDGQSINQSSKQDNDRAATPVQEARSEPLTKRNSTDDEEDTARPCGDASGADFFSSFINNTSLCSGFGSLNNLRKLNFEDFLQGKKNEDLSHDNLEEHKHPNLRKLREKWDDMKPDSITLPVSHKRSGSDYEHKAHPVYAQLKREEEQEQEQGGKGSNTTTDDEITSGDDADEDGEDEEEEEEEEKFLAKRLTPSHSKTSLIQTLPSESPHPTPTSSKRAATTRTNSTKTAKTTTTTEPTAAAAASSSSLSTSPTKTLSNEDASKTTSTSVISNITSYSTIDSDFSDMKMNEKSEKEIKIEKHKIGDEARNCVEKQILDGDEQIPSEKNLTSLQKSVIQNLDPHSIREGVLIKVRQPHTDQENHQKNDNKLTESKKRLRFLIAEKLQRTFHLKDDDIFYGNYSSWLVKDVLLQGHMYLTKDALLYFAFLPKRYTIDATAEVNNMEDSSNIIMKGNLGMKTGKLGDTTFVTPVTHKYWTILRPETMSIYSSSTDLYFPITVIDMRTCLYAEIADKEKYREAQLTSPGSRSANVASSGLNSPPSVTDTASELRKMLDEDVGATEDSVEVKSTNVWIKLVTRKKTYRFQCDNLYSARQWCSNLTKTIFQLNNANLSGEVLVKIPIANIVDFRKKTLFDEVDDDDIDPESNDIPLSLSIKYHTNHVVEKRKRDKIKDKLKNENDDIAEIFFLFPKNGTELFNAFDKIMQRPTSSNRNESETSSKIFASLKRDKVELDTSISTLTPSSNFLVKAVIESNMPEPTPRTSEESALKRLGKSIARPRAFTKTSNTQNSIDLVTTDSLSDSSQLSLPIALSEKSLKKLEITFETTMKDFKDATKRYEDKGQLLAAIDDIPLPSNEQNVDEKRNHSRLRKQIKSFSTVGAKLSATPLHYRIKDKYFVQSEHEREVASKNFQKHFSLFNSQLVSSYYCHVLRTLPVYGKLYVSDHEVCFRSLLPGVSTTMIIPMLDIAEITSDDTKLSYAGATIIVQGVDEMTIEFSSSKSRDDFRETCLEILAKLHENEGFRPQPHQWGSNYNIELAKTRMEYTDSERRRLDKDTHDDKREMHLAKQRVALSRIKMFEDRLNAASGLEVPIVLEDSPFFKTEMRPSTSYNITLLTIGSRGDVQPYIALGKGLQKEGHKVTIATHSEFKEWIEKYHIGFREIAGDPGELMSFMVGHSAMSVSFLKDAQAKFKDWIKQLLSSSWKACQGADILIESPSAMAGIHIAEALAIPYFRAFTMPWTRTRAYPQAFFVPEQKKGGSYNYLTHVIFENIFWKGTQGQINRWRVNELDLPKTNLFRLQQTKVPFLYNVSPSVMPPATDFPSWVKVTGYWFLDEGGSDYEPPKELLEFMDQAVADDKKIVYIGFGSIVVDDSASLTKAIVDAVIDADVRCILNKGWSDRMGNKDKNKIEVEWPPEVYSSGSIPHDWLFPKVDAAVHHGGSGTTGATLKAGCPSIIKPFFGDQFFYATRIEDMGVGIALRKLTKKSLASALVQVTEDLRIVEKAKKVSLQINHEFGVLAAIESIYTELEYSRNLIAAKDIHNENYKRHHPDFKAQSEPATDSEEESEYGSDKDDDDDTDEEEEDDDEVDEVDEVDVEDAEDVKDADNHKEAREEADETTNNEVHH